MGRTTFFRPAIAASLAAALVALVLPIVPASAAAAPGVDWAFAPQWIGYPSSAPHPTAASTVLAGDFDDDGTADIAAVVGQTLLVYQQEVGGGSLESTPSQTVALPSSLASVAVGAVGDWDGDGDTDIALRDPDGIAILEQDGGALGLPTVVDIDGPSWLRTIAWDGDQADELLVSGYPADTPSLLLLDHDAGWSVTLLAEPNSAAYFDLADFNDDGLIDAALPNQGGPVVDVALQQGDGTVEIATYAGITATKLSTGDLTGDGFADIAFGGSELTVLPNNGDGTFGTSFTLAVNATALMVRDLNADGADDIISNVTGISGTARVSIQGAGGTFSPPCNPAMAIRDLGPFVEMADLNTDGLPDVLARAGEDSSFGILWGAEKGAARIAGFGAGGATISWGSGFSSYGTLSFGRVCPSSSAGGVDLSFERANGDGTFEVLETRTTNSEGFFEFSHSPPKPGTHAYRVVFAGDATHESATGNEGTITVSQPAGLVDVAFATGTVDYNDPETFTVELEPYSATSNLDVDLYLMPTGKPERFWKTVTVDAGTGTYEGSTASLKRSTRLRAQWAGDADWQPSSGSAKVSVRMSVTGRLAGPSTKVGQYRVYKPGKVVYLVTQIAPWTSGPEVVALEVFFQGRWRPYARQDFKVPKNGSLVIAINPAILSRHTKYRIVARKNGASVGLLADTTGYLYFRVT